MDHFWYIVKEGKFLTARAKFTDNFNLANLYDDREKAEHIAKTMGGEAIAYKKAKWVVVKDDLYLSNNGRFVQDIEDAYYFNRSTSEQYARELKGNAVQVLTS